MTAMTGVFVPDRAEAKQLTFGERPVSTDYSAKAAQLTRVGSVTSFAIAATAVEFAALKADWKALEARAATDTHLFQSFEWLSLWVKHFVADGSRSLCVVTIRRDGALVCALPLIVESVFGLRQLEFMGAPVSQYGDALVVAGSDRVGLVRQAWTIAIEHTKPSLVRLEKVREDASIAQLLALVGARETAHEYAPFADLARHGNIEGFRNSMSAKKVKNMRRLRRRLDERGAVCFDWSSDNAKLGETIKETVSIKRAWLAERGLVSKAFADTRFEAFFAEAAQARTATGVQVATLTSAGEMANAMIIVEKLGRVALHVTAYNLAHERLSVGTLHIEALVEEAYRRGARVLDFMAPRHEYKDEWADDAVRVSDYAVPVTAMGAIYSRFYLAGIREGVKKLSARMPAPLMRFISGLVGRGV